MHVAWRAARPGDLRRALLAAGLVVAALLLAPAAAKLAPWFPECNFHRWSGWACPSCGATRASIAFARGQLGAAFSWNPLVALAASVLALGGLAAPLLVLVARRVPAIAGKFPAAGWWWLAAAVLANWVYLVAAGV